LLCALVVFAEPETGVSSAEETQAVSQSRKITRDDSVMDLAKKAALQSNKAVEEADVVEDTDNKKIKKHLKKLVPALKDAAVGVAYKASVDAATAVTQDKTQQYEEVIKERKASEKAETAAKALAAAAQHEADKQEQVALSALQAEKTAAQAAKKKSKVASFELQQHLAMLKTKRKAVEAEAAAHGKQAVEPKVAEEVQAKVAPFSEKADTAEAAEQTAKAVLDSAKDQAAEAATKKNYAMMMRSQRQRLEKQRQQEPAADAAVPEARPGDAADPGQVLDEELEEVQTSSEDSGAATLSSSTVLLLLPIAAGIHLLAQP